MKTLDASVMNRLFSEYENSFLKKDKKAKGIILDEFESLFNADRGVFYRAWKKYCKERSILTACNIKRTKKSRLSPERQAKRKEELLNLAATKEHFRGTPTEITSKIINPEQYTEIGGLSTSQKNRLLRAEGISTPMMAQRKPSTSWVCEYSNQLFMVDASPMEAIFLNFDNELKYDKEINFKDKHISEILVQKKLRKVWVYYLVDIYSRAYLVYAVADLPSGENSKYLGENTIGWRKAFTYAFLPKNSRIPMEGVPDGVYSDQGSGLISNDSKSFLTTLNPEMWIETHVAKHPWAKGPVESRIGAWKRTIEKFFTRELVKNFDDLQQRIEDFVVWDNERKGFFQKWISGTKDHPIRKVSQKNIDDATVTLIDRIVNTYQCVSIEGRKYYIPDDVPVGAKVDIYRRGDQIYAQLPDNTISVLDPAGPVSHGIGYKSLDGRGIKLSERLQNVEEVKTRAKSAGKNLTFDNIRPESTPNIGFIPARGEKIETHSVLPPDSFATAKDALNYFTNETGITREESTDIFNDLEGYFKVCEKKFGKIPSDYVIEIVNHYAKLTGTEG